jgi:hypothetical protein
MKISRNLCLSLLLLSCNAQFKAAPVMLTNSMLKVADQAGFFNDALLDIKLVGKELINFGKGNCTWKGITLTLEVFDGSKESGANNQMPDLNLLFKDPALIYGATYVVISHKHPQAQRYLSARQKAVYNETDDIFSGSYAIHPLTGADLPIYISNYANSNYAMRTGHAYLAVPAHKHDDFYFAKEHNLPITLIIQPTAEQVSRNFRKADLSYRGVLRSPYIVQYDECHMLNTPSGSDELMTGTEAARMIKTTLIKNRQAKKHSARILYTYNNKPEPFSNILKIEAFIRKNKRSFSKALYRQKKAELDLLLSYAHADFLEIVESFLASVKSTKQLMIPLVEESSKLHRKKGSYLMRWSNMSDNESERVRFKRDIVTFIDLARFCSSLIEFLADLSNSCPHAQAYLESLQNEQ